MVITENEVLFQFRVFVITYTYRIYALLSKDKWYCKAHDANIWAVIEMTNVCRLVS